MWSVLCPRCYTFRETCKTYLFLSSSCSLMSPVKTLWKVIVIHIMQQLHLIFLCIQPPNAMLIILFGNSKMLLNFHGYITYIIGILNKSSSCNINELLYYHFNSIIIFVGSKGFVNYHFLQTLTHLLLLSVVIS